MPEPFLVVLVVLGLVAAPFVSLVLLIVWLGRHKRDQEDLSDHLGRIARKVERMQDILQQLVGGAGDVGPGQERPVAGTRARAEGAGFQGRSGALVAALAAAGRAASAGSDGAEAEVVGRFRHGA